MLSQFRQCYPQGSLMSELITIDCGQYIVRVSVQIDGMTLATGLAAARMIEEAEDKARQRALDAIDLTTQPAKTLSPVLPPKSAPPSPPSQPESEPNQPESTPPVSAPTSPTLEEISPSPESSVAEITPEPSQKVAKSPKKTDETVISTSPTIPPAEKEMPVTSPEPTPEEEEISVPPKMQDVSTFEEPTPEEEPLLPLSDSPSQPQPQPEPEITPPINETPEDPEAMDFSEIIAQSNAELKRLRWTQEEGRDYLIRTYGKRSRQLLSDEELMEFLYYLQGLPTPPKS